MDGNVANCLACFLALGWGANQKNAFINYIPPGITQLFGVVIFVGAFPAHRLGLYYSVGKQLRHYPGTSAQRRGYPEHQPQLHQQREPAERGSPAPPRARSHTAPNGRPLLSLQGAQVRSAPQALTPAGAGGGAGGAKDLTLPRIYVGQASRR